MKKITVLLCLFVLVFSTHSVASQKDGLLRVYFLSVGQGDAELIITPNGNTILIDGGPDNSVLSELGRILPFYEKEIDVVMATHPHADHIAGLIEVLERYQVNHIVQARDLYGSSEFVAWQNAVKKEGANNVEALAGTTIDFGTDTKMTILYPERSYAGTILKKPHEANVTAMLSHKDIDVLFTGDMEADVERELVDDGWDLRSEILKVGHHGSKTSTSTEFLDAVQPEVAFIGVGVKNRYGLPYPGVLQRLGQYNIQYYRTDEQGTMEVVSDGHSFQVRSNN